ncbi:MAG: hypothetical protein ACFBSC_04790 [Microcoleaceae cyanobacterium]
MNNSYGYLLDWIRIIGLDSSAEKPGSVGCFLGESRLQAPFSVSLVETQP